MAVTSAVVEIAEDRADTEKKTAEAKTTEARTKLLVKNSKPKARAKKESRTVVVSHATKQAMRAETMLRQITKTAEMLKLEIEITPKLAVITPRQAIAITLRQETAISSAARSPVSPRKRPTLPPPFRQNTARQQACRPW